MAIIHVDESAPGLPNSGRLSGTNGDLVGIMDVALPMNGWSIEYTSGNARVYRPGSGNRFRLHMNDDSAVSGQAYLCTVRGCENASDATTLVDPFPQVAQVGNTSANWIKSNAANTTARAFDIWVAETWVLYAVNWGGTANVWELHGFGDFAPSLAGDSYNTYCTVRNSTSGAGGAIWFTSNGMLAVATAGTAAFWLCRTYDGATKSVRGGVVGKFAQSSIGFLSGPNAAQSGPTTGIDVEKMQIIDSGSGNGTVSASLCLPVRGYLPNLLSPQHGGRGALNTRDDFTNTSAGMAVGKIVTGAASSNSGFAVVQESDDWTPPNG
jgi:hypothetical protein